MASSIRLPRRLPLLIVDGILFPGASIRIPVTSFRNMNMVKSHLLSRSTLSSAIIGVVPKNCESKDDDKTSMHEIGTAGEFFLSGLLKRLSRSHFLQWLSS